MAPEVCMGRKRMRQEIGGFLCSTNQFAMLDEDAMVDLVLSQTEGDQFHSPKHNYDSRQVRLD